MQCQIQFFPLLLYMSRHHCTSIGIKSFQSSNNPWNTNQ